MTTLQLPPTLTIQEASELLGIAPWTAYELVKRDEFPVHVLRCGRTIRVPSKPLADELGLDVEIVTRPLELVHNVDKPDTSRKVYGIGTPPAGPPPAAA